MNKKFNLLILGVFVFLFSLAGASASVDLNDGLVGYWAFDEGTGSTAIDLVGNYNATLSGSGGAWSSSGFINGTYQYNNAFDTDSHRFRYSSSAFSHEMSTGGWFYSTSSNSYMPALTYESSGQIAYRLELDYSSKRIIGVKGASSRINAISADNVLLNNGTWQHIFMTVEDLGGGGYNVTVYLDGEQVATATGTPQSMSSSVDPTIGNRMNGRIDEVLLYNRTLSSAEIEALYKAQKDGFQYPFEDAVLVDIISARDGFSNAGISNFSLDVSNFDFNISNQSFVFLANYSVNDTISNVLFEHSAPFLPFEGGDVLPQTRLTFFYDDSTSSVVVVDVDPVDGSFISENVSVPESKLVEFVQVEGRSQRSSSWFAFKNFRGEEEVYYFNESFVSVDGSVVINETVLYDGLYELRFYDVLDRGGYFNKTFRNVFVSTPFSQTFDLDQAFASFTATSIITEDEVTNFNVTINDDIKSSTETWSISAGLYNATFSKSGWYNKTLEINVSALSNETYNFLNVYNSILNVTAIDNVTSEAYSNFSLIYELASFESQEFNTTTGFIELPLLINETYDLSIFGDGIAPQTQSVHVNLSYQEFEFSVFKERSIFFTIFDVVSGDLIDDREVELDLISDIFAQTHNTTNASIYATLLEPTNYIYRVRADDYNTYYNHLIVTEETGEEVSVYMTPVNGSAEIEIRVIDELTNPLEDARVTVLRYNAQTNTYIPIGGQDTDNEGKVWFDLLVNEEFYRFRVDYRGNTVLNTAPRIIRNVDLIDGILLQVSISPDLTDTFTRYRNIQTNLVYNNETQNFRLDFSNDLGSDITMCLVVDRPRLLENNVLIGKECMTASSGTILFSYPLEDFTVRARAVTNNLVVNEITVFVPREVSFGIVGLFIQLILTLVFVGFSLNNPKVMVLSIGFSLLIGKLLNFHDLSYTTVWISIALGLIITYALREN